MLKMLPFTLLLLSLILGACGNTGATTTTEAPPEPPAPTQAAAVEPTTIPATEQTTEPADTPTQEATTEIIPEITDEAVAAIEEPTPAPTEETLPSGGARTFVIVPEESVASYIVAEEFFSGALNQLGIQPGLVDTIGSTQQIEGELQLDLANLAAPLVSGYFTVNLESLTSDQPRRDRRIRSADLESSRFPLAVFVANSVEGAPASYAEGEPITFQVLGDMTIRDITRPVVMDVTATLNGDTLTGSAVVPLRMSDFGFNPPNFAGLFAVADEFRAEVQFTMREK